MTNVVRKTRKINDIEFERERAAKRRGTWGSVVERATKQAKAQRLNSSTSGPPVEGGGEEEDSPSWRPKSPLGSYLWLAAKLYQLIDEAADWRLIGDHLCTQSPLHVRRTLEQYSCWTAEETLQRDRQQVVYRGTKQGSDPEAIPRVVMVDQLWLWILDESEYRYAAKTTERADDARHHHLCLPPTMGAQQARPVGRPSSHSRPSGDH